MFYVGDTELCRWGREGPEGSETADYDSDRECFTLETQSFVDGDVRGLENETVVPVDSREVSSYRRGL